MLAESGMGNGDLTLRLNELGTTETEEITLTDVSPAPRSTVEIAKGEYRLTFVVTKR
jgi:hypothetical protein